MNLSHTIRAIFIALSLISFSVFALQPPTKAQLERYKQQGTLQERISKAKGFANDQVNPNLLQSKHASIGQSNTKNIGAATSITPWKNGFGSSGTQKTFTLLLAFSDALPPEHQSADVIYNHIYGDGDPDRFPNESLTNFYYRSSYEQLEITGEVLDWYITPYTRDEVTGEADVIKEALRYYEQQGVDFSQYDNDNDGIIDYFSVIWTGEVGEWASQWWGHQTKIYDDSFILSGKTLATYSWQWLSHNNATDDFDPQVLIHETGHALGLPDYYDYDSSVGAPIEFPVSDMMRNNLGDHNAFSKFLLGWIEPTFIGTGQQSISLKPSSTSKDALMIMPGLTAENALSEYFVVQHRDKQGNDKHMSGEGLLIWHVDANIKYNNFEFDNSYTAHNLIRLLSADEFDYYQPGHELTSLSTPSSQGYKTSNSAVEITAIEKSANIINLSAAIVNTPLVSLSGIKNLEALSENNTITANIDSTEPITNVKFFINGQLIEEDTQAPYQMDFSKADISVSTVDILVEAYTATAKGSASISALNLQYNEGLVVVNLATDTSLSSVLERFTIPTLSLNDIPMVSPTNTPAMFISAHNTQPLSDEQFSRLTNYVNAGGHLYFENSEWFWNRDLHNQQWQNFGIEATWQFSQNVATIYGAENSIVSGVTMSTPDSYFIFHELVHSDNNPTNNSLWFIQRANTFDISNTVTKTIAQANVMVSTGMFAWLPTHLQVKVMSQYLAYFEVDNSIEPVSITIANIDGSIQTERHTDITFSIERSYDNGEESVVNLDVVSENAVIGQDYIALTQNQVTFLAGELIKSVTLTIQDDFLADGDKALYLSISGQDVISEDTEKTNAYLFIQDNEFRGKVQFSQSNTSINEDDGTYEFTVERIDGVDDEITFSIATHDGSAIEGQDYHGINEEIIMPANFASHTFVLTLIDNSIYEANKNFTISLTSEHLVGEEQNLAVTIVNDDDQPIATKPASTQSSSSGGSSNIAYLLLIMLIYRQRTLLKTWLRC
ncbi:M6 family metalloprotease domain-containing protein [Colwellia asteriadis]|uniref:M6 family metalloprotease domain-containing protein n=1 Tax=Colwellia asteriadis TaxID=517723 RepID=UPI0031D12102